jgi:hypothetical protein
VLCWGANSSGQLGDGTTTGRLTPVPVSGLTDSVKTVAVGRYHTCALTTSGGVLCWGYNKEGQLGDGTTTDRLTPDAVSGLAGGVAAVSTHAYHACALTTGAGVLLCWGDNERGQLGDGTTIDRLTPVVVSALPLGVGGVSVGGAHTCAVTTAGDLLCWGYNGDGRVGDGTTTDRSTPTAVSGLDGGVAAVAAGGLHTCALTRGGAVACWGFNGLGAVGDGTTTDRWTPTPVIGFEIAAPPSSDFSGDSKSDILWRHATGGDVWLWPMDGAGRTMESYVRTIADTTWEIRSQGDQDGDGKADLLWRNKLSGQLYFWPMDGATPQAEIYVATVDPVYDIVGTGDLDGDGKSDILWRNLVNGEVWIWLMNGATLKPGGQVYIDRVDPGYVVRGVDDLDGDTKADIVWHGAAGDVWVWPMNGTTRLDQVWVGTVPDTTYQIQQVADFDRDGKADILWWNTERGEVWIWPMDGTTVVSESYVGTVPDTNYQIVGAGDYDGDTNADILWRNVVNGEVWIWLMNGTTRQSENYVGTVPDVGYQIVKSK